MNFLPTDEFRRLCKDEKSFRELNEILQSFVAVSGAGTGKEYWKAYLDHCSDLVLEIDGLGKIIAIHSIGKSTGEKQFIGRGLKMLLPSILAKKLPSAIENAFSSLRAEKMFLGNDNETPFLVLSPLKSREGFITALAIFPVAKFRSGIKKRLNESERKYRYLFEHANDSILITEPETHSIIDANGRASKELGYSLSELLEMTVEDITSPENESTLVEIRKKLFSKGHSIFETVHMDRQKRRIPVEVSSSRIQYEGKPAYLNFVRNISDRKRVEDLLVRKGEELNAFLYRASHDLKGPIATIRGLLLVAGLEVTDPVARYYFNLLNTAAGRLDTNLTDLIQISTINRIQLTPSKIDMNEVVSEVLHELSSIFDLDSFKIDLKVTSKISFVSDRKMLRNIFMQLLSNAMKYSSGLNREPEIGIFLKPTQNGVEITISDNGMGIPDESKERIFDLFFRANSITPGNGLGLTILRNLVQKLAGEINLESQMGVGTSFKVKLPSMDTAKIITAKKVNKKSSI